MKTTDKKRRLHCEALYCVSGLEKGQIQQMKKSQCKTCSEGMLEKGLDFSKLGKSRSGRGGVGSNCNMETDSGSLVDGRLFCKIGHFLL